MAVDGECYEIDRVLCEECGSRDRICPNRGRGLAPPLRIRVRGSSGSRSRIALQVVPVRPRDHRLAVTDRYLVYSSSCRVHYRAERVCLEPGLTDHSSHDRSGSLAGIYNSSAMVLLNRLLGAARTIPPSTSYLPRNTLTPFRYINTMSSKVHQTVTLPSGRETSVPTGLFMYVPLTTLHHIQLTYIVRSNNEWTTSSDNKTFSTVDPSTGAKLLDFSHATPEDVDTAVKHARKAFKTTWGKQIQATERAARTSLPPPPKIQPN